MLKNLSALWQAIRPHQWLKNVFILSGLVFGHAWGNLEYVIRAFEAIFAFILVSSAGYLFNDLCDRRVDAQHPQKKHRPIASGTLSTRAATAYLSLLLLTGLWLGFYISPKAFILLMNYSVLVAAYSIVLKQIPWIELLCVVLGFMLRILLGTWGIGIPPSLWVISCGFLLALFLILAKRSSEQRIFADLLPGLKRLATSENKGLSTPMRSVLHNYDASLLRNAVYGTALACVGVYALYAFLHGVTLTIVFVIFGVCRYLFLFELRSAQGIELDVAHEFFRDKLLQLVVGFWFMSVVLVVCPSPPWRL